MTSRSKLRKFLKLRSPRRFLLSNALVYSNFPPFEVVGRIHLEFLPSGGDLEGFREFVLAMRFSLEKSGRASRNRPLYENGNSLLKRSRMGELDCFVSAILFAMIFRVKKKRTCVCP